jgi:ribosome-binding protein aMBF1 (putative translation factor)
MIRNLPLWFWPDWFPRPEHLRGVEAAVVQRFDGNVRTARQACGWTQEELARRTGLVSVQVSRIERGRREVRLTTFVRLLAALEASPAELLEGIT